MFAVPPSQFGKSIWPSTSKPRSRSRTLAGSPPGSVTLSTSKSALRRDGNWIGLDPGTGIVVTFLLREWVWIESALARGPEALHPHRPRVRCWRDPSTSLWWATLNRRAGVRLIPQIPKLSGHAPCSPAHARLRRVAGGSVHTGSWHRIWLCDLAVARSG